MEFIFLIGLIIGIIILSVFLLSFSQKRESPSAKSIGQEISKALKEQKEAEI